MVPWRAGGVMEPITEWSIPLGGTLSEDHFVNCFINSFVNPSLLPWPVTFLLVARGWGNRQSCSRTPGF